tara:strand:+ start:156 stop:443 length:288 start_codon:yes stop_codon:yes gene_type:complete
MITISNIGDMSKPAQLVSTNQQLAIFSTGVIWCKYSLAVVPVNYNLMIVNFFMGLSAGYQLYRKTQVPAELGGFWGAKKSVSTPVPVVAKEKKAE